MTTPTPTDSETHGIDPDDFGQLSASDLDLDPSDLAPFMAEQICLAFIHHDQRDYETAVESFHNVDRFQFAHLSAAESHDAAVALTDAFWDKDVVEEGYVADGDVDQSLADADWSAVVADLRERARIVGMDRTYADQTVNAWINHKTGGDYWTPTMAAQAIEIDAAIRPPGDRHQGPAPIQTKPKYGTSGFGPLPALYLVGLELHDMHTERHWNLAVQVMTRYYALLLLNQQQGAAADRA